VFRRASRSRDTARAESSSRPTCHGRKSNRQCAKGFELRDRIAARSLQLESADRSRAQQAEMAIKVFELSQSLTERWVNVDYAAKRQILQKVCLNFSLDRATIVHTMRKSFDILVEGPLVLSNRGDRI